MATTEELVNQAAAADTADQLDAIAAQSQDPGVQQAVLARRDQLAPPAPPSRRTSSASAATSDVGPNAVTDPAKPKEQYFEIDNGDGTFRKVNAWGEEKGSPEDKKRW